MDAHARRAETQAWGAAVVVVAITLACAAMLWWMEASAPAAGSFCTTLASGQVDTAQLAAEVVAQFTAMCG
jgi:hypothetical protein